MNIRVSLGISLVVLFLWITHTFALHVTGMLGVAALAVSGVESIGNLSRYGFGNPAVIFLLSITIIIACVRHTSLIKRSTLLLLLVMGTHRKRIIFAFLLIGSLLAPFVTKIMIFSVLLSLAQELIDREGMQGKSNNFTKALMLATLWGPTMGCIGSITAAHPNAFAITLLQSISSIHISSFTWMSYGMPVLLLSILPAYGILSWFFPQENQFLLGCDKKAVYTELASLPSLSKKEWAIIVILLFVILSWVTTDILSKWLGFPVHPALPALIGASLLLLPPFISVPWKRIEKDIAWNSIILVATASAIGVTLYHTKAVNIIADALFPVLHSLPVFLQMFSLVCIAAVLRIFMSNNSAGVAFLVPTLLALAPLFPMSTVSFLMPVIILSSAPLFPPNMGFTNAYSYAQGYYSVKEMIAAGSVLTVVILLITSVISALR